MVQRVEFEQSVTAGREIVEKHARLKAAVKLEDLARRPGSTRSTISVRPQPEEFSLRSIEQALVPTPAVDEALLALVGKPREAPAGRGKVLVVGVDSLLTQLARCCRPAPPDEIGGYVTRGRGVSIHRARCSNLLALVRRQPERVVEVTWGRQPDAVYPSKSSSSRRIDPACCATSPKCSRARS